MPSRLKFLVAFSLLLLVSANPRPVSEAPLVTPSGTAVQDWSLLLRRLEDERIYRLAVWYSAASAQRPTTTRARASGGSGRHRGYGSTAECIAAVENGGDYGRSTNPTHFGKYQFSRSTWEANGGDPGTWGYASPEEQERVFRTTVERNGYRDWTPYDGCG